MKIVFLDVDGVLNAFMKNPQRQSAPTESIRIDKNKVRLLAEIVRQTGASLVLHSGWRFWFDDSLQLLRPGAKALVDSLQKYNLALMDKTPDMTTAKIRNTKQFSQVKAKEIRAWLAVHPEVTRYMVLEDLDLHDPVLAAFQVKTDPGVGLTQQDVDKAICLLNDTCDHSNQFIGDC